MADAKPSKLGGASGQGGPRNDGVSQNARENLPPDGSDLTIAPAGVTVLDSGNTRTDF